MAAFASLIPVIRW